MLEHRLGELTHSGGERTRPRRRLPQHATKPVERPRTIASILETSDGMTPEQTMTRIVAAVPETTPEDLFRALNEYEEQLDSIRHVATLCGPVIKSGEAANIGEALRLLAEEL